MLTEDSLVVCAEVAAEWLTLLMLLQGWGIEASLSSKPPSRPVTSIMIVHS